VSGSGEAGAIIAAMGFQVSRHSEGMLSVEDAQRRVMAEIAAGPAERVSFQQAAGRVLREDIVATADAPEGDNSAMDGYAVRAADIAGAEAGSPVRLRVAGDIPAGHLPTASLEPKSAMRIMTGALLPAGADTVVQVELTDAGRDFVSIQRALESGANVRRRGEDMRKGDVVLKQGGRAGPPEVALLAALQKTEVLVGRRPEVAIISTGDELVDAYAVRPPGKIVNSNSYLLAALVREAGAAPRLLDIVRDTRDATIGAFEAALASDFIVSSGGVSVGAYDFVKEALDALCAETKFWRVAMKPGKPVVLSRLRERLVFGLPGNPVSCFVSFHLFVAPALRKAMGQTRDLFPPRVGVTLMSTLRRAQDRRVYYRVRVEAADGELQAWPLATQGSGSLTSMLGANGLAVVEPGDGAVESGERAEALLLGPVLAGPARPPESLTVS
jgi:molybdopterin molybdotransferase